MTLAIEGERLDASVRIRFSDFGDGYEVAVPDEGDVRDVTREFDRFGVHFTG